MQENLPQLPPPGEIVILPDGGRLLSRPASGKMGELEAVRLAPPGHVGDMPQPWGEAHIRNGPGECRVPGCGCGQMHIVARNKIVGQGLRHMCNIGLFFGSAGSALDVFVANNMTISYIRVGTGSGATLDSTTGLVAPVATNPSTTSILQTNPSAGVYRFSFTATWNAGTITGATVTEIGVFARLSHTLGSNTGTPLTLFSRLSVSDSEFSSFVINTAAPLTIEYRVTFSF